MPYKFSLEEIEVPGEETISRRPDSEGLEATKMQYRKCESSSISANNYLD
jgi:hypothetical protein